MQLYVIRHTKPAVESGICYGQVDLDVAQTFEAEAKITQSKLPKHVEYVYSSPLLRCRKLADYLYPNKALLDSRIMEYNFGDWEGLAWNNIEQSALTHWMENYLDSAPPNGETMTFMIQRIGEFIEELKKLDAKNIIIITHSGVVRVLHHIIEHLEIKATFNITVEYGSMHRFSL